MEPTFFDQMAVLLCVGLGARSSGHNQEAAAYKTTSCTEGLVAPRTIESPTSI